MENKGDIENQSEEIVGDTKLRVVTLRGGARLQLSSPHSHNVPEPGRKTVLFVTEVEEGKKEGLKMYQVLVELSLEMITVGARRMLLQVTPPLAQKRRRRAFLDLILSGRGVIASLMVT